MPGRACRKTLRVQVPQSLGFRVQDAFRVWILAPSTLLFGYLDPLAKFCSPHELACGRTVAASVASYSSHFYLSGTGALTHESATLVSSSGRGVSLAQTGPCLLPTFTTELGPQQPWRRRPAECLWLFLSEARHDHDIVG